MDGQQVMTRIERHVLSAHELAAILARVGTSLWSFPRRNGTIVEPLHHTCFPRNWNHSFRTRGSS